MTVTRVEWAEKWPDGQVRLLHQNHKPVGQPARPTPYAHRGTTWVRRTVIYGDWEEWEPDDEGVQKAIKEEAALFERRVDLGLITPDGSSLSGKAAKGRP